MCFQQIDFKFTLPGAGTQYIITAITIILTILIGSIPINGLAKDLMPITVEWRLPASELKTVRNELNLDQLQVSGDPASVKDTRGLPAIYIVSGVFLLPQLAKSILDVYKNWKYGNAIITQDNSGKLSIIHDPNSTGNSIIFVDKTGKVTFRENSATLDHATLLSLLVNATENK